MEPNAYAAENAAILINSQINAVSKIVDTFSAKVGNDEIQDLDDARNFFDAWLAGMRTLQQ